MVLLELSKALAELSISLALLSSSTPASINTTSATKTPYNAVLSEYNKYESRLIPLWAEERVGCSKRKDKEFCKNTILKIMDTAYEFEVSPKELVKVAYCESRIRHKGIYGDRGKAFGLAQFWFGTFNLFKKEAGLPHLEYKDMDDQITLMAWSFANGKKNHWTCAKQLTKK